MEENKNFKKILIIDDDKFLLEMYAVQFKDNGFEVVEAFGSVDALNKLKEGASPDVILLDLVMPTMDGFEFLELVKRENLVSDAKIIVLSNLGQPSDIERVRELGAHGFIIKASATPSEVVERVAVVLDGGESFVDVE